MVTSSTERRIIIISVKGTVKLRSLLPYVSDNDLDVIIIDVNLVYDYSNNDEDQLLDNEDNTRHESSLIRHCSTAHPRSELFLNTLKFHYSHFDISLKTLLWTKSQTNS